MNNFVLIFLILISLIFQSTSSFALPLFGKKKQAPQASQNSSQTSSSSADEKSANDSDSSNKQTTQTDNSDTKDNEKQNNTSKSSSPNDSQSSNDKSQTSATTNQDSNKNDSEKTDKPEHKTDLAQAIKHYNRAVELHKAGFLNQAIEEYNKAIENNNDFEQAYSNLGILYVLQHNYKEANITFEKALKLKPDRATTLNGLATSLYALGKTNEAKKRWLEIIKINPSFSSAYYNVGIVFDKEKNYLQAQNYYLRAIEYNPKMIDSYYRLADLLFKSKEYNQAKIFYEKVNLINSSNEYVKDINEKILYIDKMIKKARRICLENNKKA